jgi:transcription elongation factor GreA
MALEVPATEDGIDDLEVIEGSETTAIEDGVLTLERAVSAYFENTRTKLGQHERVAVTRFVSWYGPTRGLLEISAHEMTLFQDSVGSNAADLSDRLMPVKAFFAHAKKKTWTPTNLGVHLRVKRSAIKGNGAAAVPGEDVIEMTPEGFDAAQAELERLKAERPKIQNDLALAMADKDFRENAPLDAARDSQAMLEAQIRNIEHQIRHAVTVELRPEDSGGMVHLGSHIGLKNLESKRDVVYTLVSPNEVDAAAGRISVASPMGQALVGRMPGDEVEVAAPSGPIRFRVETVEG